MLSYVSAHSPWIQHSFPLDECQALLRKKFDFWNLFIACERISLALQLVSTFSSSLDIVERAASQTEAPETFSTAGGAPRTGRKLAKNSKTLSFCQPGCNGWMGIFLLFNLSTGRQREAASL
jgi:hypothetical protein